MIIKNLKSGKPSNLIIKKGMNLKCLRGRVWATAAGRDFILECGAEIKWCYGREKMVILPVGADAVMSVANKPSLFKEFSLFDQQPRLTGSFAG